MFFLYPLDKSQMTPMRRVCAKINNRNNNLLVVETPLITYFINYSDYLCNCCFYRFNSSIELFASKPNSSSCFCNDSQFFPLN